jgi:glucokinase
MSFLGVEIGGTKLQLGIGDGAGAIAALWRGQVVPAEGAEGIRRQILGAVPDLLTRAGLGKAQLRGIGVGFGGPVDDATRSVIKSHQIAGWDQFPLGDWIGEALGLPAVLGNDADVAGLAEASFGAGRGLSPVFYVTLGSGIGGGLIIDGAIHRGVGKGAAEIGHLRLWHEGRWDVLEHFASGWAIDRKVRELARSGILANSPLGRHPQPEALTARDVGEAAAKGDAAAAAILDGATMCLAQAFCQVIALVCPRRFVVGGGLSLIGEPLFAPLRRHVAEMVFKPFAECFDIVPASLGEEVVVQGALALARRNFG